MSFALKYFDCYNGESICLSFLFQGKRKGSKPKKIAVHKHFSSADYIDEDDDELMLVYFEEYGVVFLPGYTICIPHYCGDVGKFNC